MIPVDNSSLATASPILLISKEFIVEPNPILCGNIVAPMTLLWPCTASVPHKIGTNLPSTIGEEL